MEAATTAAALRLSYTKFTRSPSRFSTSFSLSPSFFHCTSSLFAHQSAHNLGFRGLKLLQSIKIKTCPQIRRNFGVVLASEGENASTNVAQGWLLEPVGDGDWRHIGQKVAMPGAYEIFSSEMTVGRMPEKADLVIPVATVSGVHARIENKEGSFFVTDLDSTNGTYVNEQRVPPGATAPVPPGSLLTFGDTHLAIFRVSKLEKAQETEEPAESQETTE